MTVSRRDFLRTGGLITTAFAMAGCSTVGRELARRDLPEAPTPAAPVDGGAAALPVGRLLRFINRAGYGPQPGQLAEARAAGFEAYLEQQLAPETIDDQAADLMIRNLNVYHMDIDVLLTQDREEAVRELLLATTTRAIYSHRHLYEAMVEFWSDHFNIYLRKNKFTPYLKLVDDRDVIRPNALGKFRDLLVASAHSPAMLMYLDNVRSLKDAPNENYARELMELHTLGVDGGYTQQDVQELARILTGWSVHPRGRLQGQFFFNEEQHDDGEKILLGQPFPAGRGEEEGLEALDLLAAHPSTARFISTKLVRRFVADDPPASLVERVSDVYLSTDGDIKEMLRTIFLSEEFSTAPPKLKRPFSFMVSALRALGADLGPRGYRDLGQWIRLMGQMPFMWPPPDGYPDESEAWASNLLPRWNFGLLLATGGLDGVGLPLGGLLETGDMNEVESALDTLADMALGQVLDDRTRATLVAYIDEGDLTKHEMQQRFSEVVGLILAGPAFQWA